MDDEDDYFDDGFVLDDATLAVLNKEEQKFIHGTASVALPPPPLPKAPERELQPKPKPVLERATRLLSQVEDRDRSPPSKRIRTEAGWQAQKRPVAPVIPSLPDISVQSDGTYGMRFSLANGSHLGNATPPQQRGFAPGQPVRQTPPVQASVSKAPVAPRPTPPGPTRGQARPPTISNPVDSMAVLLQRQTDELRRKMEELQVENARTQAALQEAIRERRTKEGEVAILRKNIERAEEDHASQVAAFREERQRMEERQIQIQKETKEEIERMKTQMLFKQQELEASARRPPSTRINRHPTTGGFPSTPLLQSTSWSPRRPRTNAPLLQETPMRSPRRPLSPRARRQKSPEKPKRPIALPGFQNAFDSNPLESPRRPSKKGKEKEDPNLWTKPPSLQFAPPASPDPAPAPTAYEADDDIFAASPPPVPIANPKTPPPLNPPPLPPPSEGDDSTPVSLNGISPQPPELFEPVRWPSEVDGILQLLSLIKRLTICLPDFLGFLFAAEPTDQGNPSPTNLMEMLCTIVTDFPKPKVDGNPTSPIEEVLHLMESMAYRISPVEAMRLRPLLENRAALCALFNTTHPPPVLALAARALASISTYHTLATSILGRLISVDENIPPERDNFIEQLCSLIMTSAQDENYNLKADLIAAFGQMTLGSQDALFALGHISTLPLALIALSYQLTRRVWEDDPRCIKSPEYTTQTIDVLVLCLSLLSRLVFKGERKVNLKARLHLAPRLYHCISHTFVVTFGRLAHSVSPSWVNEPCRAKLEAIGDICREILEEVVEGPEIDNVWEAFNGDSDEENVPVDDDAIDMQNDVT